MKPLKSETMKCQAAISESGLIDFGGWEIEIETGEGGEKDWVPRMSWARTAKERLVQVFDSSNLTA